MPATRVSDWTTKFDANERRDKRVRRQLRNRGWLVAVVWECQTRPGKQPRLRERLARFLESG